MKILYRQKEENSLLGHHGFADCCLKKLCFGADAAVTTGKSHRHNEVELHLITRGTQTYAFPSGSVCLSAGEALLILPGMAHRAADCSEGCEKYAISFRFDPDLFTRFSDGYCRFPVSSPLMEALLFCEREARSAKRLSPVLIENRLFEALVIILRIAGYQEGIARPHPSAAPDVLSLAKCYIADNIECAPTVQEVAGYCHLSEKQLSRIFRAYEGQSLFDYIRASRVACIKLLLSDPSLSLGQISERMHFGSEYYFSAFFKKNYGMPPGIYRKMACEMPSL